MSWAEVKKINSDLTTPINIANLINHIDVAGSAYVGRYDLDIMKEILRSNGMYSHEIATSVVSYDFWEYVLNSSASVGNDINQAFGIGSGVLPSINTVGQLLVSPEALWEIGRHYKSSQSLIYYPDGLAALSNCAGFMSGLLGSHLGMTRLHSKTKDGGLLPVHKIRSGATGFAEMHNASNLVTLTTVGSGNYVVPAGVETITAICISGGGSGAGGNTSGGNGGDGGGLGGTNAATSTGGQSAGGNGGDGATYGGGGGGGAYRIHTIPVTVGQVIPYTVGAGGRAGAKNGDASRFGDSIGTIMNGNQAYVFPAVSTGGGHGNPGGGGAGGFGGGNGVLGRPSLGVGGVGGLTYGAGGGGSASNGGQGGGGGGGYGGGGGGMTTLYNGGQGIIALHLGRSVL